MRILKSLVAFTVLLSMFSCGNQKADVKSLATEIDSASYALGLDMAIKIKANIEDANADLFIQGYRNGMDSTNLLIPQEDINAYLNSFFQKQQIAKQKEAQEKAIKDAEAIYEENKLAGESFLAENKTKDGVETTASGLQYIVLKKGNGERPAGPTTKVKVHYHGTTINGEVFDSSVDRKTPAEFGLNQVIKGWTEGLQLMDVGSKYKLFVPQELAYGYQQRGELIKPFSALVFEVELLEILK